MIAAAIKARKLKTLNQHLNGRQRTSIRDSIWNHDGKKCHASVRIAQRMAGGVTEIGIEIPASGSRAHHVVPSRRRHIRARNTDWNFDAVHYDFDYARDFARAK